MNTKDDTKVAKSIRKNLRDFLSGCFSWIPKVKYILSKPNTEDRIAKHTKHLKYLLNDPKGREQLVDYLIHEAALQGVINEVMEQMKTETPVEEIKNNFIQEDPDINKKSKVGAIAKFIGAELFKKRNGVKSAYGLTDIIFRIQSFIKLAIGRLDNHTVDTFKLTIMIKSERH